MVATANTAEAVKMVKAVKNCVPASFCNKPVLSPITKKVKEISNTDTMPMPEIGLEDEPIKPAI